MTRARTLRVHVRYAAVALAAAALSCSPSVIQTSVLHGSYATTELFDPSRATTLGGTCSPSGIETCFDARDNNCDGLFEEGCGLPDGPLQLMIAWELPLADVDLEVFGPDGEVANVGVVTRSGLTKDRDCPKASNECGGQNVEVVYLESESILKGTYRVTIRLEKPDPEGRAVRVHVGGHIGGQPFTGEAHLDRDRARVSFEFRRP